MSHGALLQVSLSALLLGSKISSILGDKVPTRVFQSPHIMCFSVLGKSSRMSYIRLLVSSSLMPLLIRLGAGGM